MKLKHIVGLEEKEFDDKPKYTSYSDGVVVGHNSCLNTEVVVDEKQITDILTNHSHTKVYKDIAHSIATAIESGSIISLKEKK